VLHDYIGSVHEELTDAYHPLSDKQGHTRECPVSQGYVYRPGPCNCDAPKAPEEASRSEIALRSERRSLARSRSLS
jgi:hypothetical protein